MNSKRPRSEWQSFADVVAAHAAAMIGVGYSSDVSGFFGPLAARNNLLLVTHSGICSPKSLASGVHLLCMAGSFARSTPARVKSADYMRGRTAAADSAFSNKSEYPNFARTCQSSAQESTALVDLVNLVIRHQKFKLVAGNDAYCQSVPFPPHPLPDRLPTARFVVARIRVPYHAAD
jgi:hypothetical protein